MRRLLVVLVAAAALLAVWSVVSDRQDSAGEHRASETVEPTPRTPVEWTAVDLSRGMGRTDPGGAAPPARGASASSVVVPVLEVEVVDGNAAAIEAAAVHGVVGDPGRTRLLGRTDGTGRVVVRGLALDARTPLWAITPLGVGKVTLEPDGAAKRQRVRIQVMPAPGGPALVGRIVERGSRQPLAGVEVSLSPAPRIDRPWETAGPFDDAMPPVVTGSDGRFRLPGIPVRRAGCSLIARRSDLAAQQVASRTLEPSIDSGDEVTIEMSAPVRRSGTVKYADGSPARDVTVGLPFAHSGRGWLQRTRTDATGRFELDVPNETTRIEAILLETVRRSARLEPGETSEIEFVLPVDGATRVLVAGLEVDRTEGCSLYLSGELSSGPYTIRDGATVVHIRSSGTADVRIYAPPNGTGRSRLPLAVARGASIEKGVSSAVVFQRAAVGAIRVTTDPETIRRLGPTRSASILSAKDMAFAEQAMRAGAVTFESVPVGRYRVATTHRESDECPSAEIEVRAGVTVQVEL